MTASFTSRFSTVSIRIYRGCATPELRINIGMKICKMATIFRGITRLLEVASALASPGSRTVGHGTIGQMASLLQQRTISWAFRSYNYNVLVQPMLGISRVIHISHGGGLWGLLTMVINSHAILLRRIAIDTCCPTWVVFYRLYQLRKPCDALYSCSCARN